MKYMTKIYGISALFFLLVLLLSALFEMFTLVGIATIFLIIYTGLFFGSLRPPFLEKT